MATLSSEDTVLVLFRLLCGG